MTNYDYEVIIIGSGPGGMAAGSKLAAAGEKVLMVESNFFGGTCPNRGCDPKKMMYNVVANFLQGQRFLEKGLERSATLDWQSLISFKNSYTDSVSSNMQQSLKETGLDLVQGTAVFKNSHEIEISGKIYRGKYFILAVGSTPRILNIPGKEYLSTSDDFFELPTLPKKVGFIGSGFITMEFVNVLTAFGCEVDVFQIDDKILGPFPQSATKQLQVIYQNRGVTFHSYTEIQKVEKTKEGTLKATTKENQAYFFDVLFSAIGREVDYRTLAIEKLEIKGSSRGIEVNDCLQTNKEHIFVIGDALAKKQPKLTPVSSFEGNYVADFILGKKEPITYPLIPSIVYTWPQLAQVGVSEKEALEHPDSYQLQEIDVSSWFNYFALNAKEAKVTIIKEKKNNQMVGAFVLSAKAEVLVNYFTHLMNHKENLADLKSEIFLYPSFASDLEYF